LNHSYYDGKSRTIINQTRLTLMDGGRRTADDRQQTMDDRRWMMDDGQFDDGRWTTDNGPTDLTQPNLN
jgi:hypothetical protein